NTQRDLTACIVGKSIGLKVLTAHVAKAHQKGHIHYHDFDYSPYTPMTNSCLIDFKGILSQGFNIGNDDVESQKSIQTAT
ncbi:anaerobic ribonucleoside-triphosphate reductase, partial [Streptococcus suis]